MATMEPVANRQSSADSLDEWASEVWGMEEGEMDPPPHPLVKQAPRAKSEDLGSESPDAPKPRPQVSPSSENLTDSTNKMAEVVPKMEQEALSGVNQVPSSRIQVGDSELKRDLKMIDDNHCEKEEDAAAFRSPLACTGQASPAEGAPETQPRALEEEEEEEETIDCISDGKVEVISNSVEEEMSSSDSQGSQEWPSRSHLDDVVEEDKEEEDGAKEDKVEEFQSVEMMENGAVRLELNPASSEFEQRLSETVCATEKASVEGGPVETSSSPHQCSHLVDLAQPPGVVTPDKQQGEQLLRNVTAALTHHSNQEVAAQQVFKGATLAPPLATVAKEPANQSDSGVSADFSPGSTVELQTTTSTPTLTSPPADETPIEREIRRAVQREQSLRRSRGLHNNPPTQEYVDIPPKEVNLD
uniref:uncharacterized protein LOC124027302 n=1 Tax=Oncorhynchus gorbuscha TaxID=8017 RepID=UPI001EAED4C1|nr:uncharacterized protein LOC124027302 [Oncorhynchus gorbuscha]